jgi:hypothetical protein
MIGCGCGIFAGAGQIRGLALKLAALTGMKFGKIEVELPDIRVRCLFRAISALPLSHQMIFYSVYTHD